MARTALLATEGFTDLEELGRQARAELYRLCAGHPPPLVPARAARGGARAHAAPTACCASSTRTRCASALDALPDDCEAVAVCLLWGFRHPEHEQRVGRAARRARGPGARVDLARDRRRVPRVRALRHDDRRRRALAAAAPLPRAARPSAPCEAGLPEPEVMLSSGGVADARAGRARTARGRCCRARRAARWAPRGRPSAPARRAPSAWTWAARRATCRSRSTAARRSAGGREVGGRALALPMVDVHTVGAGGGSDRVARRRRRAARGPALGGRRSRAGLLRPRRHGADRDRREPACSATSTRRRRWRAACELDRERRRARRRASWPTSSGSALEEAAAGIVRVAERRDGAAPCAW